MKRSFKLFFGFLITFGLLLGNVACTPEGNTRPEATSNLISQSSLVGKSFQIIENPNKISDKEFRKKMKFYGEYMGANLDKLNSKDLNDELHSALGLYLDAESANYYKAAYVRGFTFFQITLNSENKCELEFFDNFSDYSARCEWNVNSEKSGIRINNLQWYETSVFDNIEIQFSQELDLDYSAEAPWKAVDVKLYSEEKMLIESKFLFHLLSNSEDGRSNRIHEAALYLEN